MPLLRAVVPAALVPIKLPKHLVACAHEHDPAASEALDDEAPDGRLEAPNLEPVRPGAGVNAVERDLEHRVAAHGLRVDARAGLAVAVDRQLF